MKRRSFLGSLASLCAAAAAPAFAEDGTPALWGSLQRGGHVVLMRHGATVPGVGDPPGFQLDQCATQRNLSEAGRQDARDAGAAFRQYGLAVGAVLSSRWCRCLDTAQLAFGRVQAAPMLDSLSMDEEQARQSKLMQLRAYLKEYKDEGNLILVTHDVNIRALVDEYANPGEMIVAVAQPDGSLRAVGRLPVGRAGDGGQRMKD